MICLRIINLNNKIIKFGSFVIFFYIKKISNCTNLYIYIYIYINVLIIIPTFIIDHLYRRTLDFEPQSRINIIIYKDICLS